MQTTIHSAFSEQSAISAADEILRSCVHCGFCLSVCPTYLLTGNEADSPRGRIYLIKNILEKDEYPSSTLTHLDRCLTCRACETVCPSGVDYASLLNTGRILMEQHSNRHLFDRGRRWLLVRVIATPWLFGFLLWLGRIFRPLLPDALGRMVPPSQDSVIPIVVSTGADKTPRRILVLEGCAQSTLSPQVNRWLGQLLALRHIDIAAIPPGVCCGALEFHSGFPEPGIEQARRVIDFCWPEIEAGVERIVVTASGCGAYIKEYAQLLAEDESYREKAEKVSRLCCDAAEIIADEFRGDDQMPASPAIGQRLAWHSPCTLQNVLKVRGEVEQLLVSVGYELVPTSDQTTCCGSAGSYSLLERTLAVQLQDRKIKALTEHDPDLIVTANVGCQFHLQGATSIPVKHWLELYAQRRLVLESE